MIGPGPDIGAIQGTIQEIGIIDTKAEVEIEDKGPGLFFCYVRQCRLRCIFNCLLLLCLGVLCGASTKPIDALNLHSTKCSPLGSLFFTC